mmetsp:Transcript_27542/g.55114  ORF Transcript_27542/g.55114 Transcript_27542/m.55114 type:complete len:127 (+) Transcript_27542:131-511(+)
MIYSSSIKRYLVQILILQLIVTKCIICDINMNDLTSKPCLLVNFENGDPVSTKPLNLIRMYLNHTVPLDCTLDIIIISTPTSLTPTRSQDVNVLGCGLGLRRGCGGGQGSVTGTVCSIGHGTSCCL